jgi:hypothetical protein
MKEKGRFLIRFSYRGLHDILGLRDDCSIIDIISSEMERRNETVLIKVETPSDIKMMECSELMIVPLDGLKKGNL